MTLVANGVDLIPNIAKGGLTWKRSDVDGPNAGRLLSGHMQRDRVATKIRFDVKCRPLEKYEVSRILTAIEPEVYSVTYTDFSSNTVKNDLFYSNNFPVTLYGEVIGGKEVYTGLSFPMIMV